MTLFANPEDFSAHGRLMSQNNPLIRAWMSVSFIEHRGRGDEEVKQKAINLVTSWSDCEEIPHIQGQRRSPGKTIGGANSHLESSPIPASDAQRTRTNLVCTRTWRPHRD